VNARLVNLGIAEDLLDGLESSTEEILAKFLETSTGERGVKIDTLEERIDFDGCLSGGGESSFSTLASGSEATESTGVAGEILFEFPLELLDEVVDETVVKVLSTKMGVTSGSLDFKDALFDGQKRDIESSSAEIEDENVTLADNFLVETVSDGGSGGFVDNTEDVKTRDDTGVLSSLSLRVVEVSGDGYDSVRDVVSEVGFGRFLHLQENHGRDFLGCEFFLLALEFDLNHWFPLLVEDGEREVLEIRLYFGIVEFATDEALGIEDTRE
jgi:hypothetical protein